MSLNITTLANGLRIVTDYMPHVESVTSGMWVHVGSRNETKQTNGVAHFLEHMAFKGTTNRSALQIAQEIESVGAYMNAYTGREITAYYVKSMYEDLPMVMDVISDIMLNSTFDPIEFEREQGVILQEIGQTNDTPDDIVFDYYQEQCYPNQPLGWPILGDEYNVKNMTPDTIRNFMKTNYSADRMVFAASGNVDHDLIVRQMESNLCSLPTTSSIKQCAGQYIGGNKIITKDLEQTQYVMGYEGLPYNHPDFQALNVYCALLGAGMSSRLFQEVREKRGLVYGIQAFPSSFMDTGLFTVCAGTDHTDLDTLSSVIDCELQKTLDGFTPEELTRAKMQIKAQLRMGQESTTQRCERLAHQHLIYNQFYTVAQICEKIDTVDNAQLQRVIEHLLQTKKTSIVYGPVHKIG